MKKYLILTILFFSFVVQAQGTANRFFYELTYKPHKDSLKTEKELMVLDIKKDKSIYQSYKKVELDSIFQNMLEESKKNRNSPDMNAFSSFKREEFQEQILKVYPIKEIQFSTNLGLDVYKYEETPNFKWKIEAETKKIGTYNTQKASVKYGGRIWTAWFSTEIPFQDGPYKFHGLPGLIIKIEDTAGNYSWVLSGNKTMPEKEDTPSMFEFMKQYGMSKDLTITKEKFEKLYKEHQKNPTAGLKQMLASYGVSSIDYDTREIEKTNLERLARRNNSIEILSGIEKK